MYQIFNNKFKNNLISSVNIIFIFTLKLFNVLKFQCNFIAVIKIHIFISEFLAYLFSIQSILVDQPPPPSLIYVVFSFF